MKFKQFSKTRNELNTYNEKMRESQVHSECLRLRKIRSAIKAKQSTELSEAAVQHMVAMLQNIDSQLDTLKARLKPQTKQESNS